MVDVPDRPDVQVRLVAYEFFLSHLRLPPKFLRK
jgi:hypothetical protein